MTERPTEPPIEEVAPEERGRLGAAIKILEQNEERGLSQFNIGLVTRALVTLQELNSGLFEEWVDKIAAKLSTSQTSVRNSVQGLIEADTGESLLGGFTPPPDVVDDPDLPRILGRVPDPPQRFLAGTTGAIEPYRFGDHVDPFASLGGIRIRDLQLQLERAGLLEKGEYHISFWDIPTGDAMKLAMGFANEKGVNYKAMLTQLALDPFKKSELRDPAPLTPDPASIAQEVKATFRQRLGREPSASELREMGAALGGFEEESQAQQAQQAELAKAGGIPSPSDFTTVDFEGETIGVRSPPPPATPVEVDPVARFLELFDKRFGPEEARNRRVFDTASQRRSVMSSLTTMRALIEGG